MGVSALDACFLAIAIVSASTATTWFALLPGHPIMKACWRLQIAAVMQIPMLVYELRQLDSATLARWRRALPRAMVPTGALMGAHFSAVSACATMTSLSHAVLVINTAPLFLVTVATLRFLLSLVAVGAGVVVASGGAAVGVGKVDGADSTAVATPATPSPSPSLSGMLQSFLSPASALPPTTMEASGAILAFGGVAALVLSAAGAAGAAHADESRSSLAGDIMGLFASFLLCYYWLITGRVRKWCPLFSWLCPLNAAAAATCALFALAAIPGTTVWSSSAPHTAVFGWLAGGTLFWYATGAAVFASSLGHGMAAMVIGRVGPLPVAVAMLLQPPSGICIGYLAGVQGPPGITVLACAPIILYGAFLVTVGGREKGLRWTDVLRCRLKAAGAAGPASTSGSSSSSAGGGGKDADTESVSTSVSDWDSVVPAGGSAGVYDAVGEAHTDTATGTVAGRTGFSKRKGQGLASQDSAVEMYTGSIRVGVGSGSAAGSTPARVSRGPGGLGGSLPAIPTSPADVWQDPSSLPHVPRLLPAR